MCYWQSVAQVFKLMNALDFMKKVKVLVNEKDELAFLEVLGQMIERQRMSANPVKLRRNGQSMIEISAP